MTAEYSPSAGIEYLGPVTPQEMAAIIDADEPRSTLPSRSQFQERIDERLKRAAQSVYGFAVYNTIIRALNDEGFAVVDKASGSEVTA